MAKFGPQVKHDELDKAGLEIFVSKKTATKNGGRKVWVRVQGIPGSTFRIYECLSYARSADVCFQEVTEKTRNTLKPRKPKRTGPSGG
jgi:hypothetical protein